MPAGAGQSIRWAERHKLIGVLHAAVKSGGVRTTAAERVEIRERLRQQAVVVAVLESTAKRAVDALKRAGVDVRLLKGPASAHLDMPAAWWRGYVDVDLLVRAADIGRVGRILGPLGADRVSTALSDAWDQRFSKSAQYRIGEWVDVDVHRMLTHEPFGVLADPEALFAADPDHIRLGEVDVPVLCTPDRLLHAALHAVCGGHPMRAWPLIDLWVGSHALDVAGTAALLARADRFRATGVLQSAVQEAASRLGVDPADGPPLVREIAGYQPTRWERAAISAFRRPDRRQVWRTVLTVPVHDGGRWAYLREQVLPDRAYLEQRQMSRLRWIGEAVRSALR